MKSISLLNSRVLAEFGQSSLKILDGNDGLELSLERAENGRLTALCIQHLIESLQVFFKPRAWSGRRRVLCAIGARGVSLRKFTLPAASKEELARLVLLQIEREFPVLPEELAWGHAALATRRAPDGKSSVQEVLVAAIRRDLLQQYDEVLTGCGLTPTFTIAALMRRFVCPHPPESFAVLDIGRTASELISFENGAASALRVLPFGGETITQAIKTRLGLTRAEAEKLKLDLQDPCAPVAVSTEHARDVLASELPIMAGLVQKAWVGQKLYLTGGGAQSTGMAEELARKLGEGITCERIAHVPKEGRSAAILALQQQFEKAGGELPLVLKIPEANDRTQRERSASSWKWAALAALMAIVSISLRYAEPLLGKSELTRRLDQLRARKAELPQVDRELGFLQHLKTNQPPYLDSLHAFASSAPQGTRIDSLSLNRRGDLSLRATLRSSDQVVGFRSKLVDSGAFATVVVDEQTPSADRQKVTVRITGQRNQSTALASHSPPTTPTPPTPTKSPREDAPAPSGKPDSVLVDKSGPISNAVPPAVQPIIPK